MPNTAYGFPYPAPTDPVAQGAAAIQALAEAIEAKLPQKLIGEQVLAADGRFDFAAIPATFRHLRLVIQCRSADAAPDNNVTLRFNGDASGSYDVMGDIANQNGQVYAIIGQTLAPAQIAGLAATFDVNIFNYARTTFERQFTCWNVFRFSRNQADYKNYNQSGGWRGGAAISRVAVDMTSWSNKIAAGSIAQLYGVT